MKIELYGDKAEELAQIKTPVIVGVIERRVNGMPVVEIEIKDFTIRRKT